MSHKNVLVREKLKFSKDLKFELKVIEEYSNRCHDQFKVCKVAREDAISQPTAPTLQIDWPEKAKMRHAREGKSTYYDEC